MGTPDLIKVFADIDSAVITDVVAATLADEHVVEELEANGTVVLVLRLPRPRGVL